MCNQCFLWERRRHRAGGCVTCFRCPQTGPLMRGNYRAVSLPRQQPHNYLPVEHTPAFLLSLLHIQTCSLSVLIPRTCHCTLTLTLTHSLGWSCESRNSAGKQAVSLHTFRSSVVILLQQSTDSYSHLTYAASFFNPEAMQVRGLPPTGEMHPENSIDIFPWRKEGRAA